jgi:molybdopterin converting factor small subunit
MNVRVTFPAMFQHATGNAASVELADCKTVGECFKKLRNLYPYLGKMLFDEGDKISSFVNVFINGQRVGTGGEVFTHRVEEGDEIYPIMLIDGG